MGAGTLNITKVLDAIQVAVAAVVGVQASYQGFKVPAEATNLDATVRGATPVETKGWFNFDPLERTSGKAIATGGLVVAGELRIRVAKDTDSDLNSAYELAERVYRACQLEANYSGSGAGVEGGYWKVRDKEPKDGILFVDYELRYFVGPICT